MRKYLFFLLLLSFVSFSFAKENDKTKQTSKSVQLNEMQVLELAKQLISKGDFETAKQLYIALLKSPILEIRIEAVFNLSQLYAFQKDYKTAISYLDTILDLFPKLTRIRFELARVYFLNEEYDKADENFSLVKADEQTPQEVVAIIDDFLEKIRRQKNWSVDFGLAFVPDSNINNATKNTEECVIYLGMLLCRPLEDPKNVLGIKTNFTANYFYKFNDSLGIKTTLYLSNQSYPKWLESGRSFLNVGKKFEQDNKYRQDTIYIASGPRYVFKNGETSLQGTYTKSYSGGKQYSDNTGIRLGNNWNVYGNFVLSLDNGYQWSTYHKEYINDILRGNTLYNTLGLRYYLNSWSFVNGNIGFNKDETKLKVYSSDSYIYGGSYYAYLWWGFSTYFTYSLTNKEYKDENVYVKNLDFESIKRKDEMHDFSVSIQNNKMKLFNIVPSLRYSYTKNTSNVDIYNYERHRGEIIMNYEY